jgi:hypothetical protein
MSMLPGLEEKYNVEIETISKTRDMYRSAEYQATGLPIAPAAMLGDEILVQGKPLSEEALKEAIRRYPGIGNCRNILRPHLKTSGVTIQQHPICTQSARKT